MQDYKKEKRDVEAFIVEVVRKLSEPNKQRVADILTGMTLAVEPAEGKPQYPQGITAHCG